MERDLIRADASLQAQIDNLSTTKRRVPVIADYTCGIAQSIPNNTTTIVRYDTLVKDTHSQVVTGVAWRFTSALAQTVHVDAALLFDASTTWALSESAALMIYKNGAQFRILDRFDSMASATAAQYLHLGGGALIDLAAGEYLDIRVLQVSGGALPLIAAAVYNYVSIHRI
jgi:hypothetical protein